MVRKIETFSEQTQAFKAIIEKHIADLLKSYRDQVNKAFIPFVSRVMFFSTKDGKGKLGYCERETWNTFVIGISETLLSSSVSASVLMDIAGHELAHAITSLEYPQASPHGPEFKEVCRILGIESNSPTANIQKEFGAVSNTLNKIKKLLALSESPNMNEAQSALMKAKSLMRDYGISERVTDSSDEKIFRTILTSYNSLTVDKNTLIQVVSQIVDVWMIHSYANDSKVVYAHGTKSECEIAGYLWDYLEREFARLYKEARMRGEFSGHAKSSFYYGILKELESRFAQQKAESGEWALTSYSKENRHLAVKYIYPSTTFSKKTTYTRNGNKDAYSSGKKAGQGVRIHSGIGSSSSSSTKYLS